MKSVTFLILILATFASCEDSFKSIVFKNCKSKFEVTKVESTCNFQNNKCIFLQGEEPKIKIHFKATDDVESLKTGVRARLDGSFVDFHIENDNICDQPGMTCPIKKESEQVYVAAVPIRNEYPAVDVQINWQLLDTSNDEQVVCIVFLGTVLKS
uniref:ML domain-containing protein n=1 Tax=Parastrongyloides trichosuri TaxID=131310 RepID=A0A0N4ZLR3_PARTI